MRNLPESDFGNMTDDRIIQIIPMTVPMVCIIKGTDTDIKADCFLPFDVVAMALVAQDGYRDRKIRRSVLPMIAEYDGWFTVAERDLMSLVPKSMERQEIQRLTQEAQEAQEAKPS